jgi:ribonuclease HI
MPLSLRRSLIMGKIFLRFHLLPHSPMSPIIQDVLEDSSSWPFADCVRGILHDLAIPRPAILPFRFGHIAPWTFPGPVTCFAISSLTKSHCPDALLRNSFLSHAAEAHSGSIPVYTDGSKQADGVGSAAVFPDITLSHSFPRIVSIFTAELCAIILALFRITNHPGSAFTIYSDSRSALQALEVFYTPNPLVMLVQQFLYITHVRKKAVSFCWVPAHVGIPGNDLADHAAKAACLGRSHCL